MLLNHLAAILLFSGPLFYVGLWMVVAPATFARLPELLLRSLRNIVWSFGGQPVGIIAEEPAISHKVVRFAGVALLLFAIVV
ncbi:MAG TPA: hypothetical protein VKU19_17805 [Bryobacteraceae bacterium]|nr:hypothetical protein [Bryobacteraceae bacterium]